MAAYAALLSLMQTIHDIQNHPAPPVSLDNQQVESLTDIVGFLQEYLEGYVTPDADGDEADPLEMRIADAAYAVQDVIESYIVDNNQTSRYYEEAKVSNFFHCFPSQKNPMKKGLTSLYENIQQVMEGMDLIKKQLVKRQNSGFVIHDQGHRFAFASHVSSAPASASGSGSGSSSGNNSGMVCSGDILLEIKEKLVMERLDLHIIPIVGMAGIGKTTLAKTVYLDPLIMYRFDIRVWATISQQYNTGDILCELLSQATKREKGELSEKSEEELGEMLYKHLFGRRFLIVMDDMWSIDVWDKMRFFFPRNENSSCVLVTTRLSQLSSQLNKDDCLQMKFLDEVSSWNLFTKIVFGEQPCPPKLENIGKDIVSNCRGLPLSIVVVGGLLKKLEHTEESWVSTRNNLTSLVNSDNDRHSLRLLKMSYNHLPVYLKPCFLFMGVFDEDDEIRVSIIVKLWISEGFVKPKEGKSLEASAKELVKDLVDRNLMLIHRLGKTRNIKYCKIHDLWRDLCLKQGKKEGFFHVVGQHCPRGIKSQRRLVIPGNISKKKVRDALRSMPHARSVISEYGQDPQCQNFCAMLKTLHALRYQKSYMDSLMLIQDVNLRHLVVHVRGIWFLFSLIDRLWNLHTLIVYLPHGHDLTAPSRLWRWTHIRHIEVTGSCISLPDPPPGDDIIIMKNLHILKGVWNFKFGKEVVKRIPNIKKLDIQYFQVEATDFEDDLYSLTNIKSLSKLESLNIEFSWYLEKVDSLHSHFTFPHSLKRLLLKMSHVFEWKDVLEKIGSLPLLEVLEIHHGCFQEGKWEIVEGHFPSLKYLSLNELSGLEELATEEGSSIFPCLQHLHLIELEELKEIAFEIGYIPTLQNIEMTSCNEWAVKCVKKIVEEQVEMQGEISFHVQVQLFGKNEAMQHLAGPNFHITFV